VDALFGSQALACAKSLLKRLVVVRIEDLTTADLPVRKANIGHLLMQLQLPFTEQSLSAMASVFETPINAQADYASTGGYGGHYGHWQSVRLPSPSTHPGRASRGRSRCRWTWQAESP
jgi:hypothetical protein